MKNKKNKKTKEVSIDASIKSVVPVGRAFSQ